jgi:hypothetical protein
LGHYKHKPNDERGKEGGETHNKCKKIRGKGMPILQKI